MSIVEFYNKLIDSTKNTGQGLPMFIPNRLGIREEVLELVDKGYLNYYDNRGGSGIGDPDSDRWVCIAGVYNAEKADIKELNFIRRWLGILDKKDFDWMKMTDEKWQEFLEVMKPKYIEWIDENLEELEAIRNLKHVDETFFKDYTEELNEFVKSKEWYNNNLTISEVVNVNKQKLSKLEEAVVIYDKLIDLCKQTNRNDEVNKHEKDRDEVKIELKLRKKVINFIEGKEGKIKDIFNID